MIIRQVAKHDYVIQQIVRTNDLQFMFCLKFHNILILAI